MSTTTREARSGMGQERRAAAIHAWLDADRRAVGERIAEAFRWAFLVILAVLNNFGELPPPGVRLVVNLILMVWAIANAGITGALLRGFRPGRLFAMTTTAMDIVFGAALVYMTDGFQSPYFLAFFLAIVASSVRFGVLASVVSALAIATVYLTIGGIGPLQEYATSPVDGIVALGKVVLFPAVALVSSAMARELVRERRLAIERAAQAEALQEMNSAMAACLDIDDFFQVLIDQASTIVGATQGRLILVGDTEVVVAATFGEGADSLPELSASALRRAAADGVTRVEGSMVLLPVDVGETPAPVLVLDAPAGVGGERLMLLSALGSTAARTMANALRYQRRSQEAITDGLTGLINQREFRRRLDIELARARRRGVQLSLMLIDIDRFKRVNDTMGHRHGDEVLIQVASVVRSTVRSHDVVARYGGDELAVILVDAGAESGASLAERLLQRARDARIGVHGGGHLTLSIGVASYPEDSIGAEELMMAADQALYLAKREGRDQVCASATLVQRFRNEPETLLLSLDEAGPQVVVALAHAADLNQGAGHGHSSRVAAIAANLALRIGVSEEQMETSRLAALLHETGNLAPEDVPGDHGPRGGWLLERGGFDAAVADAVRHQAECWDGSGGPSGLAGGDIPVAARVISLACAFDGITSGSSGRAALGTAEAISRLRAQAGKRFDPKLIEALAALTLVSASGGSEAALQSA